MNVWSRTRVEGCRGFCRFYASLSAQQLSVNHYDILGLPPKASIKEVKKTFKQLSKKYHPDLNTHLTADDKTKNNDVFIRLVASYEILKDKEKKSQYDRSLNRSSNIQSQKPTQYESNHSDYQFTGAAEYRRRAFDHEYYGQAKYYTRSGQHYSPSGYNIKKNRVKYHDERFRESSTFSGKPNEEDDVPHFDHENHLKRQLIFEIKTLHKRLSDMILEKDSSYILKYNGRINFENISIKDMISDLNIMKNKVNQNLNLKDLRNLLNNSESFLQGEQNKNFKVTNMATRRNATARGSRTSFDSSYYEHANFEKNMSITPVLVGIGIGGLIYFGLGL